MVERSFLITLDDSEICDHLELECMEPYCLRKSEYFKCNGDLKQRPELCPLVEHGIGDCHISYLEQMRSLEK